MVDGEIVAQGDAIHHPPSTTPGRTVPVGGFLASRPLGGDFTPAGGGFLKGFFGFLFAANGLLNGRVQGGQVGAAGKSGEKSRLGTGKGLLGCGRIRSRLSRGDLLFYPSPGI